MTCFSRASNGFLCAISNFVSYEVGQVWTQVSTAEKRHSMKLNTQVSKLPKLVQDPSKVESKMNMLYIFLFGFKISQGFVAMDFIILFLILFLWRGLILSISNQIAKLHAIQCTVHGCEMYYLVQSPTYHTIKHCSGPRCRTLDLCCMSIIFSNELISCSTST